MCEHRPRWSARCYMQSASKHAGCIAVNNVLAEGVTVIATIALHDAISAVPMLSIFKRIAAGMCIQYSTCSIKVELAQYKFNLLNKTSY